MKNTPEHNGKIIKVEIPADLYFAKSVRNFANDIFLMMGFDDQWKHRLKIVVDELFMNAVEYGSNKKSIVRINFSILENGVSISVDDEGTGQKKLSANELKEIIEKNSQNTDVTKTSGRGLAMFMKEWSDNFDLLDNEYGGIRIIFTKFLQPK